MQIHDLIERHWYNRTNPFLSLILFPVSLVYLLIIKLRKFLFDIKLKSITTLPVPVVVIGNITAGGVGKTPLTRYLAEILQAQGVCVGIVARGYNSNNNIACIVSANDDSQTVGDEALLFAKAGLKVAINAKRVDAARLLLKTYPNIQIILADDGLQHYYLGRNIEICVIDASRMFGNRQLIPQGPLRESLDRLNKVDYIVLNGYCQSIQLNKLAISYKVPIIKQEIILETIYNPATGVRLNPQEFTRMNSTYQKLIAVVAIGNPQRFFNYLNQISIDYHETIIFPDHYQYKLSDIPKDGIIITTEKDYTKLDKFDFSNIWVVKINIQLENNVLIEAIKKLVS